MITVGVKCRNILGHTFLGDNRELLNFSIWTNTERFEYIKGVDMFKFCVNNKMTESKWFLCE